VMMLPQNDDSPMADELPLTQSPARDEGLTPEEARAQGIRRAEAILFAAGEPLSAEQIAEALPHGVEPGDVLMALKAAYAASGVNLVEVAGKWRFQTAQDLSFLFLETRQVQKRLSQAALETLAIIAYGQPVTRAEIEAVRGVGVAKTVIDQLLEIGWVKVRGRRKTPGLPLTYGTTSAFLEHFGLESLDVLPGRADLEAEGLLSDVLPPGWQMPDEEALLDEDALPGVNEPVADAPEFVTSYQDDGVPARTRLSAARAIDDMEFDAEVSPDLTATKAADEDGADEEVFDLPIGFSVPAAPVRSEADDEEFDRAAMKEAVINLSKKLKTPPNGFGGEK
jgi:segregation and condensation protein B